MEGQEYKWRPMKLDAEEVMEYVRSMGASSIFEIKTHFNTDSASVRRAIGRLLYHDRVWLLAYQAGIYVTENTGKPGRPSVANLRRRAGVVNKKRGRKPKSVEIDTGGGRVRVAGTKVEVDFGDQYK